jgi:transcription elongation GreA/GreB family factor
MSSPNPKPHSHSQRWPLTNEAWSALLAELGRLDADLDDAPTGNIVRLPVADPARRRRALRAIRDGAELVDGDSDRREQVAIGRRVSIRESDGAVERYSVVLPGDGDPALGWISADSPLGTAVLGSWAGDRVTVVAPAGVRIVEVLAVE